MIGARFKVSCPACGDFEVAPRDITHTVYRQDRGRSFYTFRCPACRDTVQRPAPGEVSDVLTANGVRPRVVPLEAEDPKRHADRPVITLDDILDAHLVLADDRVDLILEALTS